MKNNILLIDDDRWLVESYQRLLKKSGFETRLSTNADEAIREVEESLPDLVVADVMLEGHTIFSLLQELQSYDDTRSIPVVLCTNLSQRVGGKSLENYGVRRVVEKSTLNHDDFISTLKECLA